MCVESQVFIRLMAKNAYVVCPDKGCWLWQGELNRNGYGTFIIRPAPGIRNRKMAHIEMYVHRNGEYDRSLLLDHHCRVRNCINPEHLEPVTGQVNTLRGNAVLYKRIGNDY